ncbi:MAG: DUF3489 domain-containing protein [Magnetococcales bacterium]|nr:DUF3489 domain-containing protein [Magnetococcales bacterium]
MNELTATQKTILEAAIGNLNGSIHPLPENLKGGAEKKVIRSMLKNGLIEEAGVETWRITEAGFLAIGLMPPQPAATADATRDDPDLEEDIALAEQAMGEVAAAFDGEPTDDEQVEDDPTNEQVEDEPTDDEQVEDEPTNEQVDGDPTTDLEADVAAAESTWETTKAETQPAFVDEPDPDYWAIAIKQFPNLTRAEWPPIRDIIQDAFMLGFNHAKPARQPKAPRQPRTDSKQAQVLEMMRRTEGATLAQIAEATGWRSHTIRAFVSTTKKKGLEITANQVKTVRPNQQGSPGSTTTYFL